MKFFEQKEREKKSLTLGLKTVLIYCSVMLLREDSGIKLTFFLPTLHRRVIKPLKFKNLSKVQYQFFFQFNEKLNVILIVCKILFYLFICSAVSLSSLTCYNRAKFMNPRGKKKIPQTLNF